MKKINKIKNIKKKKKKKKKKNIIKTKKLSFKTKSS